jgi:hypothetical protein
MAKTDPKIIARAEELMAHDQIGLAEALALAEEEAGREELEPTEDFTVTIRIKARHGKLVREFFKPTETHSMEERLAAYIATWLGRFLVKAKVESRSPMQIAEGGATVTRDEFRRQTAG